MRPIFGCPPFGGRTTVFNNNYYSMPPMMGCNCQSNFFNKIPAMIMMSAFMQNMLRPMTQCNYYPQQSYYPGLYLSGGGTEGAGGASSSSSEQNLKNLQDFYGDCRFTSITEDGVTQYCCSTPDGSVYTDTSLIDLQKQLELAGIKPKQKKEKSSSTDEVSLTRRESADEAGEADEVDGAGSAGDAGDAGGAEGAGHRTFKRADLSSITKPGGYTWIKYEELSDAQKDKLKNCKTITELMRALNSPEFGTTNLKVGYNEFHNWYKDANPKAINGENIVDITKLDLIVRKDYNITSDNFVRSGDLKFAYSVNESGITYYKRGNGGYLEKCTLDNDLKTNYPTMIQNAEYKLAELKGEITELPSIDNCIYQNCNFQDRNTNTSIARLGPENSDAVLEVLQGPLKGKWYIECDDGDYLNYMRFEIKNNRIRNRSDYKIRCLRSYDSNNKTIDGKATRYHNIKQDSNGNLIVCYHGKEYPLEQLFLMDKSINKYKRS